MAKDRSTVPVNLKWRVEDIFANTDEWNALYAECEADLDFSEFEGKHICKDCLKRLRSL